MQLDKYLEKKRRTRVITLSNQNPMVFNDTFLYSKLVLLLQHNKGASRKKLARETGFNLQRTIPRLLNRLVGWGLVEEKEGKYYALQPPLPEWFPAPIGDDSLPWFKRLAYWWLYIPSLNGLNLNVMAVWSMIVSFRRKLKISKLHNLLKLDAKTCRQAVYQLRQQRLLNGMTPQLPPEKMALLLNKVAKQDYCLSGRWTLPQTEIKPRLITALEKVANLMLQTGWLPKDIDEYCQFLAGKCDDDILWRFVLDLPQFYAEIQKQHEVNLAKGKYTLARNCRGLLKERTPVKITILKKRYHNTPNKKDFLAF